MKERSDEQINARNLLGEILKTQPNMFSGISPSDLAGKEVAQFCAEFIRQYSEELSKMNR